MGLHQSLPPGTDRKRSQDSLQELAAALESRHRIRPRTHPKDGRTWSSRWTHWPRARDGWWRSGPRHSQRAQCVVECCSRRSGCATYGSASGWIASAECWRRSAGREPRCSGSNDNSRIPRAERPGAAGERAGCARRYATRSAVLPIYDRRASRSCSVCVWRLRPRLWAPRRPNASRRGRTVGCGRSGCSCRVGGSCSKATYHSGRGYIRGPEHRDC